MVGGGSGDNFLSMKGAISKITFSRAILVNGTELEFLKNGATSPRTDARDAGLRDVIVEMPFKLGPKNPDSPEQSVNAY